LALVCRVGSGVHSTKRPAMIALGQQPLEKICLIALTCSGVISIDPDSHSSCRYGEIKLLVETFKPFLFIVLLQNIAIMENYPA
jgi:energy-converting hydrogenase Eha subunit C